jgi:hypothetical protein
MLAISMALLWCPNIVVSYMILAGERISNTGNNAIPLLFLILVSSILTGLAIVHRSVRFFDWGIRYLTFTRWRSVRWSDVEAVRRDDRWKGFEYLELKASAGKVSIGLEQFKNRDELLTWMHDRLVETNPRFRQDSDDGFSGETPPVETDG